MSRPFRPVCLLSAIGLAASLAGCASFAGPGFGTFKGKTAACDGCDTACGPAGCGPGQCEGPKRWSDEWYAQNTGKPIGARQIHKFGKAWPPFARPCENAEFSEMFHAAHYWPYPYVGQDRESVRSYFVVQQRNGWVNATTMYDYLFEPETHALTTAGRRHVGWILFDAAIHPNAIYVQKTYDAAADEARLANVRAIAAQLLGGATPPPVVLRHARAVGRPAEEVDLIRRAELENLPPPILSDFGATDGESEDSL
ncbi:MAG: hypothetical protein AAGJ97_00690 [Planctomycetota bacterium]